MDLSYTDDSYPISYLVVSYLRWRVEDRRKTPSAPNEELILHTGCLVKVGSDQYSDVVDDLAYLYCERKMGRERILLHPIFRFTVTRLPSEISRKCLLCMILQYRSKVHRQSQLGTRIPILDEFESRVSIIDGVSEDCQLAFDQHFTYLWKRQNQKRQRAVYFKSSLFISIIKRPIVSFFNYKLLTRLSCPFFAIVRAAADAERSAKLTKESDTAESTFSKQTSTAHADNFGERHFVINAWI